MMALRTTTGHPGLNTSLLVGATFWVLLAAFSLDVRDYLQQPPLLTGMSHFQGPIQQLGPGSFIIRGNASQPSLAHTEIRLTPNVGYFLEMELKGSPQVHVDLFAGPGYDSIQQEVILQAGKKGGPRTRYLYSGTAPARALFRIFFEDPTGSPSHYFLTGGAATLTAHAFFRQCCRPSCCSWSPPWKD